MWRRPLTGLLLEAAGAAPLALAGPAYAYAVFYYLGPGLGLAGAVIWTGLGVGCAVRATQVARWVRRLYRRN